jgi:ABC-type multidrug transport system fused ATPase/permease subunit
MTWSSTMTPYLQLLRPAYRSACILLLLTIASALVFGMVEPICQTYLVNSIADRRLTAFVTVAVLLVVINMASRGLTYLIGVCSQNVKQIVTRTTVLNALSAFYQLPFADVIAHDRRYFIARTYDEPTQLANEVVDTLVAISRTLITFLGAGAVAIWLSWKVALVVTAVVPWLLRITKRSGTQLTQMSTALSEHEAELKAGFGRAVDGHITVNLFGLLEEVNQYLTSALDSTLNLTQARVRYAARFQAISSISFGYAELVVSLGAGLQVVRGQLSVGGLFGFMSAYFRAVTSASTLLSQLPEAAKIRSRIERRRHFGDPPQPKLPIRMSDGIRLKDVAVGYGDVAVLERATIHVESGRRIQITGPNGSGKSTLAYAMTGLLAPMTGAIEIPPLERVSALLMPFGFVPGTVYDNLAFERQPGVWQTRCLALANQFNVRMLMDRDPATLSQGEQRKIQVLMTLMKDAELYLFDEPLANIDESSKPVLMKCILDGTQGRTLIVIMHGEEKFRPLFDLQYDIRAIGARVRVD